jgi:hypothetical protein
MTDVRENKPSASEMFRVVACQGYLNFKQEVGPIAEVESDDARLGTLVHEVLKNEGSGSDRLPDDSARWVVSQALSIRDGFIRDVFGGNPIEVIKEQRFWMLDRDGNKIFSGQVDFAAVDRTNKTLLVVDFKALYGDTDPAESNWQLISQVACMSEEMKRDGLLIKGAYGAIVQPRIESAPPLVSFTEQQITDVGLLVRRKLRESSFVNTPRTPGQHCKFCPLSSRCPEAQAMSLVLFNGNPIEKVAALTPEQIARMIPTFPVVMKVMDAVKARAEQLAAAGSLPGYELTDGYNVTVVTDIPGFYEKLKENCGITRDEFFRNLKVTKDGLEELFITRYSAAQGCSKKRAGEVFKELVLQFGEQRPTKARLVAAGKTRAQIT